MGGDWELTSVRLVSVAGALHTGISDLGRTGRGTECPVSAIQWHSQRAAVCHAGRQPSAEPDRAGALILDFQPPEL